MLPSFPGILIRVQTYEVIGKPPSVAVPTHFAKVVLTSRPTSPSTPDVLEISTGAFVLPNDTIKDETPLENFVVPGGSNCFQCRHKYNLKGILVT